MEIVVKRNNRAVIYIKDIIVITGLSKSSATRLYAEIMRKYGKGPRQFITFQEFSIYTGIDKEVVQDYLRH